MATTNATAAFLNHVSERIGDGGFDMDNDTFEVLLTTSVHTLDPTDIAIADITNEVTGNGYSRQTLTGVTWNRVAAITTFDSNNPVFTASGGDITARNYHVRNVTNDLLLSKDYWTIQTTMW